MANVSLYAGVALILFGITAFGGAIPLSGIAGCSSGNDINGASLVVCPSSGASLSSVQSSGSGWFYGSGAYPVTVTFAGITVCSSIQVSSSGSWSCSFLVPTNIPIGNVQVTAQDGGADAVIVSFTVTGSVTTTTTTTTQPGTYSIYYPAYVSLSAVQPSGTVIQTCTSSCPGGLSFYTAVWTAGASISAIATFSTGYNVCWEYDTVLSLCNPITSGSPFQFTVAGSGSHYVVLISQVSNQSPVTITSCSSAPNPCGIDATGGWSPASAVLSASGVQAVTFTFTAPSGYNCPTNWYLLSSGTNQQVLTGPSPCSGVSFTWSQMQQLEATQGTSYYLVSIGSQAKTSTLLVNFGGAVTSVNCNGVSCQNYATVVGPVTITFLAFCGQFVICQSVTWTVNGQVNPGGNQNGLTLQVDPSKNWVVSANGVAPPGCFLSTSSTITTTVCNSTTTTTTPPPTSGGFTPGQFIGGISTVAGLALVLMGLRRKR